MRPVLPNSLADTLRWFFAEHLPGIRGVSPHTLRSYRDTFVLLLRYLAARHQRPVIQLEMEHLDVPSVLAFLHYLEDDRKNCTTTRNARLAAIHAFARCAASRHPEHLAACQQLLAIPFKRARTRVVEYLEAAEFRAMLDATDRRTRDGRRDYAMLLTLFNTGARVQELLDLRPRDLQLERPYQVRLLGKGRKERICLLWPEVAGILRRLLTEQGIHPTSTDQLFRNHRGGPLTRFGVRYLLRKYARQGRVQAPSLSRKAVHPHSVRHSTAVYLLQAGVDLVSISHWLGHASVETTNRYAAIDLETKRAAITKAGPIGTIAPALARWRSDASILKWLEAL
jgi:integrase/recombinase XerD